MSFVCSKCGRECKDKRGLTCHENKCGEEKTYNCEHCNDVFISSRNLQRHYTTCKVIQSIQKKQEEQDRIAQEEQIRKELEELRDKYHSIELLYHTKCIEIEVCQKKLQDKEFLLEQQEIQYQQKLEEQKQNLIEKYESKLSTERLLKENMISMCKEDQSKLHSQSELLASRVKELETHLQEQKEINKHLNKEREFINSNMIEFAKKATEKGNTIYNGTVSNIQNNVQLQHFDGSLFRDKIIPPNRMVYSITGLVDFLHKLGIGNCYRSVDRSRKAVMWIDHDGKEIRDSNCSQLREKLLTTMEGDIRRQLEYQQNQLHELEAIHGDSYTDRMVSLSENIGFCKQLINRKASLMKELQKELSSRAKNKNDTTIDVPRIVGYTKFIAKLEQKMFPDITSWIDLSFEGWGRWIASSLPDDIEIEGAVLYKDKKFIKIRNDEGNFDLFYTSEFSTLLHKIYTESVSVKAQSIYHPFIYHHPSLTKPTLDERIKWLQEPKDKQNEEIIRGILLQKMNR